MEMLTRKKELIDWISSLDNPIILNNIYKIKKESNLSFEERCSNALTVEEFRAEMKKRIRNYPIGK
jgi:hypothetical protein